MATAKLWWNGSSWVTYDANWVTYSSESSSNFYWVRADFKIIAYDNGTILFSGTIWGAPQSNVAVTGTRYISVNGSDVGSFSMNGAHTQSRQFTVASPTATVRWYGNSSMSCRGTLDYGSPWPAGSGSTTLTSPFVTITYNANGGSGAPSSHVVCKGAACALSSTTPTQTGYTFSKWNTKPDGTGTSYAAGANITASANTTLYAIWSTNEYPVSITADEGVTITFDGDTFSNVTTSVNKPFGSVCDYSMSANAGFIIKTRDPATDGSMTISTSNPSLSATSQRVGCHLDDGNDWVQAVMYYDDGEAWHMVQAYVDNGVSWELVY